MALSEQLAASLRFFDLKGFSDFRAASVEFCRRGMVGTMRGEHWPDRFRSAYGAPSSIRVPEMCRTLSGRCALEGFLLLGSVSGDGLRTTNLP